MRAIEDRGQPSASHSVPPGHPRRLSALATAWIRAALVAVVVIVADQLSKRAIEHSIIRGCRGYSS
jgi:hypothetical protein